MASTVATGFGRKRRRPGFVAAALVPALLIVLALAAMSGADAVRAADAQENVFTVTTTADQSLADGASCAAGSTTCTLRAAIESAEEQANLANPDKIQFSLSGSAPYTIVPASSLPEITHPIEIDGTTQCPACATPVVEIHAPAGFVGGGIVIETSDSTIRGLAINGFFVDVTVRSNQNRELAREIGNNTIEGNYIGLDTTGASREPNESGSDAIVVEANCDPSITCRNTANTIRANVIGGVLRDAIMLLDSPASASTIADTTITGNRMGTDPSGTKVLPKTPVGIDISLASRTTIGGTGDADTAACDGACNLISGFDFGISDRGTGTTIKGNYIGTDFTGSCALDQFDRCPFSNGAAISSQKAADLVIGGETAAERNLISNNTIIDGSAKVTIKGNYIGTDATGTKDVNGVRADPGIQILDSEVVQVGGTAGADPVACDGACNLISGNFTGVQAGANNRGITVEGNFIGTDLTGGGPLADGEGNDTFGVQLGGTGTVGGLTPGAGNIIAFNGDAGVKVGFGSTIVANSIHENGSAGVFAQGSGNAVRSNSIHDNDGFGVLVQGGSGNAILSNSIYDNGRLGIDLGGEGPNYPQDEDQDDSDLGDNERQNFPEITSAVAGGGKTTITYSLNSHPSTTYRIEFFANDACDDSGFGEGKTLLRSPDSTDINITTNASGDYGPETVSLPTPSGAGPVITATATDPDNNTSEFSGCRTIVSGPEGATLVVEKQTLPDGSPQAFSFSGATRGSISDGGTLTLSNLAADSYQVTEQVPSGWDLASLVCTDGDSSADLASATATFRLAAGETVRCTFTDAKRGTIVVRKQTLPPGAGGSFGFSGAASGSIGDGGEIAVPDLPSNRAYNSSGVYTSTEADPTPNFDLAGISCEETTALTASGGDRSTRTATFRLDPGETVTCTFTNAQRGLAKVLKTVSGSPITALLPPNQQSFTFQLRSGASTTSAGTLLEQQDETIANGGVLTFATKLVAGSTYQLCEIVMPGWRTTLGPTAFVLYSPSGDNSTLCANFSVAPAETKVFEVDNQPPPGGLARTIGFWKNWASCASSSGKQRPVLDETLAAAEPDGIAIGSLALRRADCTKAVRLLNKSDVLTGAKMSSDPAYNLAAQLLAAKLNVKAGALTCPASISAINDAQALLMAINFNGSGAYSKTMTSVQKNQANSLATALDRYNNNALC